MMIMMTISILNYYINNSMYLVIKLGVIITIIVLLLLIMMAIINNDNAWWHMINMDFWWWTINEYCYFDDYY